MLVARNFTRIKLVNIHLLNVVCSMYTVVFFVSVVVTIALVCLAILPIFMLIMGKYFEHNFFNLIYA